MHYGADRPPILRHDPFKAIITPRPIGWIGTLNSDDIPNLAPYSFFTALGSRPNMLGFAGEGTKHSVINACEQREFTFSLVSESLAAQMNVTSDTHPDGANEFSIAGLTQGTPVEIRTPYVAESPVALECTVTSCQQLQDRTGALIDRFFVIGEVVRTHIQDRFIVDGRFDTAAARPIARLGYHDYCTVEKLWELQRP
jgi:flavin reductase (DIM6/NTAB) family NADH-FMN oxidoreductase RutF